MSATIYQFTGGKHVRENHVAVSSPRAEPLRSLPSGFRRADHVERRALSDIALLAVGTGFLTFFVFAIGALLGAWAWWAR